VLRRLQVIDNLQQGCLLIGCVESLSRDAELISDVLVGKRNEAAATLAADNYEANRSTTRRDYGSCSRSGRAPLEEGGVGGCSLLQACPGWPVNVAKAEELAIDSPQGRGLALLESGNDAGGDLERDVAYEARLHGQVNSTCWARRLSTFERQKVWVITVPSWSPPRVG